MLINSRSKGGSAVLELVISAVILVGVGFGIYSLQHPPTTQQQQITAALQQ